jgi:tRNA 2-thiouridine synthesizing protein E
METINIGNKSYQVDDQGFIENFDNWDEQFAELMAPRHAIPKKLTQRHWDILYFIRNYYLENGVCPLVYQTCKQNQVRVHELSKLFPSGYLRGACRIAGITYKQGYHSGTGTAGVQRLRKPERPDRVKDQSTPKNGDKPYVVNAQGFLVDADNWDEQFSTQKAAELKMPGALSDDHWRVIYYLRDRYTSKGEVPTVYDTCTTFAMDIEELENLFPDGYHRGAVKIAGLPFHLNG